jgi:chemotaxis protein methyltransferase CheR/two-component system CheB/CheR fusion protein
MFDMNTFSLSRSLHIAGVGASAGGLEAMLFLFAKVPATGRIAFVVAQHMAKDGHDELVVRLINRESNLPVVLAKSHDALKADTVYVIPSGKDGILDGDRLILSEPEPTHISTPSVNILFRSIALSCNNKGIGIILSGTGYDGMKGCRSLKERGAWTLAQDPSEAKFDGMPRAAIDAGVIDDVLSAHTMGGRLAERIPAAHLLSSKPTRHALQAKKIPPADAAILQQATAPVVQPARIAKSTDIQPQSELAQLLRRVHQATGINFISYKGETLLRRLDKRMAILGIDSLAAYLVYTDKYPEELKTIQHLFLVSVSSFCRDAESFAALRKALSTLLAGKANDEEIRVWVPGCAAGEEPYTVAILLTELTQSHPIRIVATDLNPDALAMAAAGRYPLTAFKEMESSLCQRYTILRDQHAEVRPEIRALVHFENRDVLVDTPFKELDLVSCRNVLIYMKSDLQDRLISSFHQSLHPRGLLFIGQSESLSFVGNALFAPVDHYHRLFRKRH